MRKITKPRLPESSIVDPRLLESAQRDVFEPEPVKTFACRICDEPGATEQSEGLCWVCRRLKISAWRDIEVQMPMGE